MIGIGEMGIEIVVWGFGVGGMVTIATYIERILNSEMTELSNSFTAFLGDDLDF